MVEVWQFRSREKSARRDWNQLEPLPTQVVFCEASPLIPIVIPLDRAGEGEMGGMGA
jgi:hypothetical protein